MSNFPQIIQFSQLNQHLNLEEKSKKDLIEFLNVSKGKILTLIKTVFSFINDRTLLKKESQSSFNKYTIDSKLVQTMSKVYDFYISNFPENGREALHELIKERYLKLIRFYEQNIEYFMNSSELEFKYYLIQGMVLLWLMEIKYDTEYYDEIIRVINGLIRLNQKDNFNINNNSNCRNEKNNYLLNFLNTILKFPYIKQNKEIIINALEVNECSESLSQIFNENLKNLIKSKNSIFRPESNSIEKQIENDKEFNLGKRSINSVKEDSYFSLMKENKKEKEKDKDKDKRSTISSISNKRKSFSNASSHKSILSSINSSGFYTPEFKHTKRDSLRHFRRFTINNINNPKTSISNKTTTYNRSISSGMNNLLTKCEEGINHNNNNKINNININNSIPTIKNGPSTKSKIRLAIQGHFYTEDDFKNNIDIRKEDNNSKSEIFSNNTESNDLISSNNEENLIQTENDILPSESCDCDDEIENNIVSVDELPINPNLSMISNSNSKNIGIEPENIIQETKEEEEIDENEILINDKNANNKIGSNNTYVKILTDNEIKNFFSQQFSDNKNKSGKNNNEINNKEKNKNNNLNISSNLFNEENKKKKNKNKINKRNNSRSDSTNSTNGNSKGNYLINNKSKKNINSQKINNAKSKSRSKNKENSLMSNKDKMKNYSQNIFAMMKSHKNNKKENVLKNKNENTILAPCTKGKEMMNNIITNNLGSKKDSEIERLPTDSVAKKNLLTLYNQMKTKK